jgi:hypothetical protein
MQEATLKLSNILLKYLRAQHVEKEAGGKGVKDKHRGWSLACYQCAQKIKISYWHKKASNKCLVN